MLSGLLKPSALEAFMRKTRYPSWRAKALRPVVICAPALWHASKYRAYKPGANKAWALGHVSAEALTATVKDQDWNECEISADGNRINHVIKGFGQDNSGEVYVLGTLVLGPSGTSGKVFKLVRPAQSR